jgi:hypothetical protein
MSATTEQLDPKDINIFDMSEDELSRLDISQFSATAEDNGQSDPEPKPATEPEEETVVEEPEDKDPETKADPEPGKEGEDKPKPKTDPAKAEDPKGDKSDPESQNVPDYKAFYDHLTKPFKANGRDLNITNPDEIITLMQMGANYNSKMAALKPNRRLLRMLEDNKLMDESQLGFLIDLHKKDPKAIAKLIQDSQFNLDEFNPEDQVDYSSKHTAPSEKVIDLEDIVGELSSHTGFDEVLNTVSTGWDAASKQLVADNPNILRILQQQKELGHFDLIQSEVDRSSILGKANGLSTLQMYSAAEKKLIAEGKLATAPVNQQAPVVNAQKPVVEKVDTTAAKKAAAAPKQTIQSKTSKVSAENLFSLSDEEFAKIDPSKFK